MNTTLKSILFSTILLTSSATAIADTTENSNNGMSHEQTQQRSVNGEPAARMSGTTHEMQAGERAQQAQSQRASESNGHETPAREQARLQMQNARSMGQQMENRGRSMTMTRPATMSRPDTSRSSRPNMR